jgi:hypothetical protein
VIGMLQWSYLVHYGLSMNHFSANSPNSLSVSPLYENRFPREP